MKSMKALWKVKELMEVRWLSGSSCEWLVKRLGSSFIFVRLEVADKDGSPLLRRSLLLKGKRGRVKLVFTEEYELEDALKTLRAQGLLVGRLRLRFSRPPSKLIPENLKGGGG